MAIRIVFRLIASSLILLIGVPLNAVVIRIYTRKISRVNKSGQREFPLMFAAYDLVALFSIVFREAHMAQTQGTTADVVLMWTFNFILLFVVNGYLMALISATIDKFFAVYFPFKYRQIHGKFVKISTYVVIGIDTAIPVTLLAYIGLSSSRNDIVLAIYNVVFLLVFVTVIVLYVLIVVKLVRSGRKVGIVTQKLSIR